jgi:hypothetical protein
MQMRTRLGFAALAVALATVAPSYGAGPEPCQNDNRWCKPLASPFTGRLVTTDPDARIRAQILRDRIDLKDQ